MRNVSQLSSYVTESKHWLR